MLSGVTDTQTQGELRVDLDAIVRAGARRMLAAALEAEVDDYLTAHAAERDQGGQRLVMRNGHARQRQVTTAADAIPVRAPRVDDRRIDPVSGERVRFRSVILPPWCRKSPNWPRCWHCHTCLGCPTATSCRVGGVLRVGAGLSAAVVRLLAAWPVDYQAFCRRDLAEVVLRFVDLEVAVPHLNPAVW
jgi:putative transposase